MHQGSLKVFKNPCGKYTNVEEIIRDTQRFITRMLILYNPTQDLRGGGGLVGMFNLKQFDW